MNSQMPLRKMMSLGTFVLLLLGVFSVTSAFAQTSYGTIAGAVSDSSGAAIPSAQVTAVSNQTSESRTVTTSGSGSYRIEALLPGTYKVTVSSTGFDTLTATAIHVTGSVTTSFNPSLKVGSASTTVSVIADQQLLQTESSEVSQTVGAAQVSNLPVSSLNPYALALTMPNVTSVTTVGLTNGVRFSFGGLRPRSSNYLIEGQDNNDSGLAGQGLQPENDEAIESVTYLFNASAPEFGRGGIASNLVYKSGSNQFHGSAWNRLQNSVLDTNDKGNILNGTAKTKYRENIYGFTLGGPIKHDKAFFFVSDQWDKYRATASLGILTLPTAEGYAVLNQYKSTSTTIANLIQAYAGLTASSDLTKFPTYHSSIALGADASGNDRGSVAVGGFQRSLGQSSDNQELVVKGAYVISDKDRLDLRLVRSPNTVPYDVSNFPSQLPGFDTMQNGTAYNAGVTENHIINSHMINELRLSYGRIGFLFLPRPEDYKNTLFGPTISISGVTGYGVPTSVPQGRFHNTYQLQDSFSWTKGNHSMKFGFDLAEVRVRDAVPFVFYGSYSYVASATKGTVAAYSALGNYLDDYSGYSTSTSPSMSKYFGSNVARPVMVNQAYYAQDTWKLTPKLTVDYGVRYEYFGAPFNYLKYPAVVDDLTCFPCGQKQKPNYMNVAPRFGLAYSLTPQTVFRAGFGIFHDPEFTNMVDNMQASSPNAATPVKYANTTSSIRGLSNWSSYLSTLSSTPLASNSQTTMRANTKNSTSYQWNAALEQALPANTTFTLRYVGTRGLHLLGYDFLNPVSNETGLRLYTTRGNIVAFASNGDSQYHGLSLQVEKKTNNGLWMNFAYTWSKALDDVSETYTSGNYSAYAQFEPAFGYNRGMEWGPSAFDHRQRAVLSLTYAPKEWHATSEATKIAAKVVNNWQFSTITSLQTGSVYNVQVGYDINYDGVTNDRPVLANPKAPINTFAIPGVFFSSSNAYCDGAYYYNYVKSSYRTCHAVTLDQVHWYSGDFAEYNNTIKRNASYTPGVFNSDVTVQRTFKLHSAHTLSLRAEVYDWLNHGNTGIPSFTLMGTGTASSYPYPTDSYYSSNGYYSNFANYKSTVSGNRNIRLFAIYHF